MLHRRRRPVRRTFETLEARWVLDAITGNGGPLVISEFMADNETGLTDGDGDFEDWIEIHNPGAEAVDLSGWHLTDKIEVPTQWQFPAATIGPGDYLVVFASSKDPNGPPGELHTNFKLNNGGEYLALVHPDGITVQHAYAPEFPDQYNDVSYGLSADLGTEGYFTTPTPGQPNAGQPIDDPTVQIIISEIMYHPSSENDLEEYIELYNRGMAPVDLGSWQFSDGVQYTLPAGTTLAPGEYLVVAADVAAFQAAYAVPPGTTVVGGWTGSLSNRAEDIELDDADARRVDRVDYADEGDWSVRQQGPVDHEHTGWVWSDAHDGLGKSLELVATAMSNAYGQNWSASVPDGGTPGAANSVAEDDAAPMILDVSHYPMIPRAGDPVVVTARLRDELATGLTATVHYREDGQPAFTALAMQDDGQSGDGSAGDGVYGATLPAAADSTVVEFYLEATDAAANSRTWPAATQPSAQQLTNLLYQVDDSFDPHAVWDPQRQPIYYLIMTEAERAELEDIGDDGDPFTGEGRSDAQFNATFIGIDGTGTELRYNTGVRNRGNRSRVDPPMNYHVNFPQDRLWHDVAAINFNSRYTFVPILGSAMFRYAGIEAADATPVEVRVNGQNLALTDPNRMHGVYAAVELYDGDWTESHFPDDPNGNLYRCTYSLDDDPRTYADLEVRGDPANQNPDDYRINYRKQTNEEEDDYSDLFGLIAALNDYDTSDQQYLANLGQVADYRQWIHFIAVDALLGNIEGGFCTGNGDDYALYRGIADPRFVLLPHDLDTLLGEGDHAAATNRNIFTYDGDNIEGIHRLLNMSETVSLYYAELLDLMDTVFAPENFNPLIDEMLEGIAPQSSINAMKQYSVDRNAAVLAQIPRELTAESDLPPSGGYPYTTDTTASLHGSAPAAYTRSVLVAGQPAQWTARGGQWTIDGVTLVPGVNRILVEAFDGPAGGGNLIEESYIDVWCDPPPPGKPSPGKPSPGKPSPGKLDSQIIPGGNVTEDMVLTAELGSYLVTGDVIVDPGVTITILPGTTVFFEADTSLTISGRLSAEGTRHRQIRLTQVPGGDTWNGVQLVDTMENNRIAYAVLEYGRTDDGMIGLANSRLSVDHATFDNTNLLRIRTVDSSLVVRNSTFTDTVPPGVAPTNNRSEHIWGANVPAGGQFIIQNNVFGRTPGHNDGIDFDAGFRSAGDPVPQILDNRFLGGGDDALDLEGDAHIEGNLFTHFHKDQYNTDPGEGNVISAGSGHEFVVTRNVFYDFDHVTLIKEDSFMTFVNNTAVDGDFSALYFDLAGQTDGPGRGAYVDGCVFVNTPVPFAEVLPETELTVLRSVFDPQSNDPALLVGNAIEDGRVADPAGGDFGLLPGSPALGSGPNGCDAGAMVAAGVTIGGEPVAVTAATAATLTVGIAGVPAGHYPTFSLYKYRLNDGPFSDEIPVETPIELTGLADGEYTVYAVGLNSAGVWQDEAHATASKTWTVDALLAQLQINEVLAVNVAAFENYGTFPDVIELYNHGPVPLYLAGMSISDDVADPAKFVFPAGTTVPAYGYLVLLADDRTELPGIHVGFSLDGDGDGVFLFDTEAKDRAEIDSIEFGRQIADRSIGRSGRHGDWTLTQPTIASVNVAQRTGNPAGLVINEWLANGEVLFADDFIELYNADPHPVATGGLFLTDRPNVQPQKHEIAPLSFIAGSGYAVFVADGDVEDGLNHVGFQLSATQEWIGLCDSELNQIDKVIYYPQTTDVSEGRSPDGEPTYIYFSPPLPDVSNGSVESNTVALIGIQDAWAYDDSGDDLGTAWREPDFAPDPAWPTGAAPLGRETGDLPVAINTEINYRIRTKYFRTHFTLDVDPQEVTELLMTTLIDDGAVFYLNGQEVFRIGMNEGDVTSSTRANRGVDNAVYEGPFSIPLEALQQGDNLLAAELHERSNWWISDAVFGLALDAAIELPSDEEDFLEIGRELLAGLRITEIMYHPAGDADAEFIELQNVGQEMLDLGGVRLDGAVNFTFPTLKLPPQAYVVVVRDLAAFRARYGLGINVAGRYSGNLGNGGEEIVLRLPAPLEAAALRFDYNDSWHPTTDGSGFALEIRDPGAMPAAWDEPQSWQAGAIPGGTPGTADGLTAASVVINEVLTHTDPPDVDTIELYNTTGEPVEVGGWWLSDAGGELCKFRVPDATVIPAGGYLVFDESDFNPTPAEPGPSDFALDGAHGDQVWLLEADAEGHPIRVVDLVEFGAARSGESLGRWPNGSGPLYPMAAPTLDGEHPENGLNSGPRIGPVVLSELMYNPGDAAGADDLEFIEIYNSGQETVDLTNWRIRGGVDYDFATGATLASQAYMVILPFDLGQAEKLEAFVEHYWVMPVKYGDVQLCGPYSGKLDDGGGRVRLLRADDPPLGQSWFIPRPLEDEVNYDDRPPWPIEADGDGPSLTRRAPDLWGNDGDSWQPAVPSPGFPDWPLGSAVVFARHVFYNNSAFDGHSAAANAQDDAAVAPDKRALLPGQTATLANYTSYSRGINGIMVDVLNPPGGSTLQTHDFEFRVGNGDDPTTWNLAPPPETITVRPYLGLDRVTLVWPDNAIEKQWLQVTVLATANTGLSQPDVFYFGNAVGESCNSTTEAKVSAADMLGARDNQRNFLNPAPIDFNFDFNRDQRVSSVDMLISRNNTTHFLNALKLITVPGPKAAHAAPVEAEHEPAHNAVLRQATQQETSSAKLNWLHEFEESSTRDRPSDKHNPSRGPLAALLASL